MKCPYCKASNTRVVDSRPGKIELEVRAAGSANPALRGSPPMNGWSKCRS